MITRFSRSSILMALLACILPFTLASAKTEKTVKTPARSVAKAQVKSPAKQVKSDHRTDRKTAKNNAEQKTASRTSQKKAEKKTEKQSQQTSKSAKKTANAYLRASGMRVVSLHAGTATIHAEVASSEAQREKGLMYRKSLPADNGMLFDFKSPSKTCMWMKNTYIPLSVAFIDVRGKVVNVEEMKPMTSTTHCSRDWIRYALEMNGKWFSRHGVKRGSRITGLPR